MERQPLAPTLRAKIATACLFGMVGVALGYAWWSLRLYGMIDDLMAGRDVLDEILRAVDTGESLDNIHLTGYVVTGIAFIAWMHAAYTNLPAYGNAGPDYKPGRAIYGWFIPFLNLVMPYRIIVDTWRGSAPPTDDDDEFDPSRFETPRLFHLWWASWILVGAGRWYSTRATAAGTPDEWRTEVVVLTVVSVLSAASAVLAVLVVRKVTARQAERASIATAVAQA